MADISRGLVAIALFFLAGAAQAKALGGDKALVPYVEAEMAANHVPGMALAIVKGGRITWSRGFGMADVKRRRPVTPETLFVAASISKTVIAAAAMRAVEEGRVSLDSDIDTMLPFSVRNPASPDRPITLRTLATHSSGIVDEDQIYNGPLNYHKGSDNPLSLAEFLRDYLVPDRPHYDRSANFRPSGTWIYSNIGAALAALVVERSTSMSFEAWCQSRLFRPIGMAATGWHQRSVNMAHSAVPYSFVDGQVTAYQHYGLATWPDGGLRTSTHDLARFLAMVVNDGKAGRRQVLAKASVREMLQPQGVEAVDKVPPHLPLPQAIFWRGVLDKNGKPTLVGHFGSDPGTAGFIAFDPATKVGAVGLMNMDNDDVRAAMLRRILLRLIQEGQTSGAR